MITMLLSRNLLSNGKRRTGTLIVLSLTSIVATVVRMDADFGPAADVKAVRTAIEQGRLLGTYRAGSTISQQGLCRWHGAWNRIFAGVAGTVDLIHAGYPPDVAKEMVAHLEESRGVDQLGRDPQASAEDRKTFGPEAIAAAAKQFKPSARCEYPAALSAPLSPK